jgi:hypothetical protein
MAQLHTANNVPTYLTVKGTQGISSGTWSGVAIRLNTKLEGNIEYDTNTGIFTLEGDKAYRVTAQLGWEAKTAQFYQFGVFNVDTGKQLGPLAEALPPNRNSCNASGGLLDVILTPPSTGKYYLKMASSVTAPPSSFIRSDCTFLNITQVIGEGLSVKCSSKQILSPPITSWKSSLIRFDDVTFQNGIDYDQGNFTLNCGKTYRITAQLGWEATTAQFYAFGLFNADTGKQIGPAAESLPPNRNTSNASGGVLDVILTPLESRRYCLMMTPNVTAGASSVIRADVSTFLNIVEVPDSKSYVSTRRFTDESGAGFKMNIQEQRGNIPYFPEDGVFILQKYKTYRITAQAGVQGTGPGVYPIGLFDYDTHHQIGTFAEAVSPNKDTMNASGGVLDVIFTPTDTGILPYASGRYHVRMAQVVSTGSFSVRGDVSTYMNVVEL